MPSEPAAPVRVLLVEDNEQNMELASFLLEEAAMEVWRAAGPEDALRELARGRPDIVLLDMNLAGQDGLSLVAAVRRAHGADVPVVALTAHAMRGDRERFLDGGCNGYITKPIQTKTFVAEVTAHLAPRRER